MLDGIQHLRGRQLVPGRRDDAGLGIVLPQQIHALPDLVLGGHLRAAEDDGLRRLDLIDEELAEVAGVHPAFADVRDGGAARQLDLMGLRHVVHHAADVAELADARGLDQDPVGMVLVDQLAQCLGEIAHQRAADTARVKLGDLDAGLLHEAAVDADLAVLIFQQHDLFVIERAFEQFFDQRGLSRAQKTRDDIDLRHVWSTFISLLAGDAASHDLPLPAGAVSRRTE